MAYIEPINVKLADVAQIVRATFPHYKGRKYKVQPRETVSLSNLNWDGGSRSEYAAATLDGQPLGNSAAYNMAWPGDNAKIEGSRVPIPPGSCMVEHSIFCGKDMGLRIYVHPSDMPRLLSR